MEDNMRTYRSYYWIKLIPTVYSFSIMCLCIPGCFIFYSIFKFLKKIGVCNRKHENYFGITGIIVTGIISANFFPILTIIFASLVIGFVKLDYCDTNINMNIIRFGLYQIFKKKKVVRLIIYPLGERLLTSDIVSIQISPLSFVFYKRLEKMGRK